jgi:hypothetical protein
MEFKWNKDLGEIIVGARVLAKKGSQHVYNTTLRSKEWLIINCVVDVAQTSLPSWYIFRGKKFINDYIKHCKTRTCMAMQKKTQMTSFLFKELIQNGISQSNHYLLILDGHVSHVN